MDSILAALFCWKESQFFLTELLDIWLGGDELAIIDSHSDSVAVINPKPISTLDFSLTEKETEFLVNAGRAAAMRLVFNRRMEAAPTLAEVEQAEREVEVLRATLLKARIIRRRKLLIWVIILVSVAVALLIWFNRTILSWT